MKLVRVYKMIIQGIGLGGRKMNNVYVEFKYIHHNTTIVWKAIRFAFEKMETGSERKQGKRTDNQVGSSFQLLLRI